MTWYLRLLCRRRGGRCRWRDDRWSSFRFRGRMFCFPEVALFCWRLYFLFWLLGTTCCGVFNLFGCCTFPFWSRLLGRIPLCIQSLPFLCFLGCRRFLFRLAFLPTGLGLLWFGGLFLSFFWLPFLPKLCLFLFGFLLLFRLLLLFLRFLFWCLFLFVFDFWRQGSNWIDI